MWKELDKLLPDVPMVYVADSGRCPYGPKSQEEIVRYSREITDFLLEEGCSLLVVACNTATAAAISILRTEYDLPFVGMEPAIKPAAQASSSGVIGILATEGTFRGNHFHQTRAAYATDTNVLLQVGEGLVEFVESGELSGPKVKDCLQSYLHPMLEAGADQVVLGCSHYPFLKPVMESIVGEKATIIDPAPAVARQAKRLWDRIPGTASEGMRTFFTSGKVEQLEAFLQTIDPASSHSVKSFSGYDSSHQYGS